MSQQVRAYIYRVLVAVGILLAGYGFVTGEQLALWLGLASAVLNVMPAMNTSTRPESND